MKKSILFFYTIFLVVVVSVITPLSVMAAQTDYSTYDWGAILTDNNINYANNQYVIWKDTNGKFNIAVGDNLSCTSNSDTILNTSQLNFNYGGAEHMNSYYISTTNNPFGPYQAGQNGSVARSFSVDTVYSNSVNITYQSETVFQSTPSIAGGTVSNLRPIITGTLLSGILLEVTSTLPILLPVLITFIAIRKGIRFTLATLRTA